MLLKIDKKSDLHAILGQADGYLNSFASSKIKRLEAHTIISELIYNIKKYTPNGTLTLKVSNNILNIIAKDTGSGITDFNRIIKDGYSTHGTLGLGFASIFRLSDEVDIETSEHGTQIVIQKSLQ